LLLGVAVAAEASHLSHGDQPAAKAQEARIELVGSLGGTVLAVTVAESDGVHTVYFGIGGSLTAMDASDPTAPRIVPVTEVEDDIRDLVAVGDSLFVAAGSAGLHVFDIRDRMTPKHMGRIDTRGTAGALAVDGTLVFVADGRVGLTVVDAADPRHLQRLGGLATLRYSRDVAVRGDVAYVAERGEFEAGLWILDVSDPMAPRQLAFIDTPAGADALTLGAHGDRQLAYLTARGGGAWIVDVSNPTSPEIITVFPPPPDPPARGTPVPRPPEEWARDIALVGDSVLLASGRQGLRILNVTDPEAPVLDSGHPLLGEAVALAVHRGSGRAYVALGTSGLAIVDVRSPRSTKDLGHVELVGQAWDVALAGDYAWVSDRTGGARSIDVSDPAAPRLGALHRIDEGAPGPIAVEGDYLFTGLDLDLPNDDADEVPRWWAEMHGGLNLAYIADPEHPLNVVTVDRERGVTALDLGTIADQPMVFVAEWASTLPDELAHAPGIRGFDHIRALRLKERGSFELKRAVTDIDLAGDVAYVTCLDEGLWTFDVSNPDDPKQLGFVATPGEALGVTVDGARAYVADGEAGVQIVDARQPQWPYLAGRVAMPGRARRVAPDGKRAWVAAMDGGVQFIDALDAYAPRLIASYRTPGRAYAIAVRDRYAYVAVPDGPFLVLHAAVLSRDIPTPTNTSPGATVSPGASASPAVATPTSPPPTQTAQRPANVRILLPIARNDTW
jgi:hypothetical protein